MKQFTKLTTKITHGKFFDDSKNPFVFNCLNSFSMKQVGGRKPNLKIKQN